MTEAATNAGQGERTLHEVLGAVRARRGFGADEVLDAKVGRIGRWFTGEGLDAAVVGVSGGVDSALVLALLQRVADRGDSSLRRVVGLSLPIDGPGATGQADAAHRARAVADALGAELWACPLGKAHEAMLGALAQGSGAEIDGWTAGQLLAVERTPLLYGAAALLQSEGHRSVVVGTTNRDEGAYLGFFGKASDAMVDLQPISDLHKSEVVALARLLGVPDAICVATPKGDVWDGRTDAELIGATYDEVELDLALRELGRDPALLGLEAIGAVRVGEARAAIERHHARNAHKYVVGSPAVHLDVLPRAVPGGWNDDVLSGRREEPPLGVTGLWHHPAVELDAPAGLPELTAHWDQASSRDEDGSSDRPTRTTGLPELADRKDPSIASRTDEQLSNGRGFRMATLAEGVLSHAACRRLVGAFAAVPTAPVDVTGRADDDGCLEPGSWRATAFAPDLSSQLWRHLAPAVPAVRFLDPRSATDGWGDQHRAGHRTWRIVGLSPVLRFMRYEPGGHHLGHYDAAYDYGDGRRTLMSVVFFLTGDGSEASGGATRLLHDDQGHLPTWERDHRDWTREARPDEVVLAVPPRAGDALLFDHRRCHDVDRWNGPGSRVIIRADVVYEAVPDGRALGPAAEP